MTRRCRNCAYCHWSVQYCSKRDADMGMKFMQAYANCRLHRYPEELDEIDEEE